MRIVREPAVRMAPKAKLFPGAAAAFAWALVRIYSKVDFAADHAANNQSSHAQQEKKALLPHFQIAHGIRKAERSGFGYRK